MGSTNGIDESVAQMHAYAQNETKQEHYRDLKTKPFFPKLLEVRS